MADTTETIAPIPTVEELKSEDHDKLQQLADVAKKHIEGDHPTQVCCGVLVAAQQIYQVALAALQRRAGELQMEPTSVRFILESMKHGAAQPFERQALLSRLAELVLPFMTAEVAAERQREAAAEQTEEKAETQARKSRPLVIPWLTLSREKTVVLAGPIRAVTCLLNDWKAPVCADGSKPVVIHLRRTMRNVANRQADSRYLEVGVNHWLNAASSPTKFTKFMANWLRMTHKNRCDLLVVDQLEQLYPATISDDMPELPASNAQRIIRAWADEFGAGVIGGVGVAAALPELTPGKTWDQLRTFADLYFVAEEIDMGVAVLALVKEGEGARVVKTIPENQFNERG